MGCVVYDDGESSDSATTIICAVVIPCVVIAIALAIWAVIFYRKTHKLIVNDDVCEDNNETNEEKQAFIEE